MPRKVIVGALILEHSILVLWFYNLLPGFRIKPPNRERVTAKKRGAAASAGT